MYIDPERYRIQLPSMPWPDGRTLTIGDTTKEELHEVSLSEPLRYRKAVEKLAYYFRREFGYDFPPYTASSTKRTDVTFLWIGMDFDNIGNKKSVGYGVCTFDYKPCDFDDVETCNKDGHWFLMWAWFHPYERRKGHLSKVWPYFQKRFGDFGIQYPISEAMEAFLDKHHDPAMKKFISNHPKKQRVAMGKEDWVGAYGEQYKTKEEYERALGYYVCMHCGGDLPEQWVKGWCKSCAQQLNDNFEEVKRLETN